MKKPQPHRWTSEEVKKLSKQGRLYKFTHEKAVEAGRKGAILRWARYEEEKLKKS